MSIYYLILYSPPNKAKLCKYFTPHSTHALIFARIKTSPEATPTAPYPFFVPLRDSKTLEPTQGIHMKWLGPSFGGVSGREYAFEFKDLALDADKLLVRIIRIALMNVSLINILAIARTN